MTSAPNSGRLAARRWWVPSTSTVPLLGTIAVCTLLYTAAAVEFKGFFAAGVFLDFLTTNAFLGVVAIGMTFVILSGGIDLSVGSVVGCTGILLATLIENHHWNMNVAIVAMLALGSAFGAIQGLLIRLFELPPFLITLAGLFFARGVGLIISTESIAITGDAFVNLSMAGFHTINHPVLLRLFGDQTLPLVAQVFLGALLIGIYVARFTAFGRNCYAVGGNEQSALLMGLPVGRTKVLVYALSGFCSALGGVVLTIYTSSGNAISGNGLELDAIAAVVVGGTLLSGGVGSVIGTFFGVLIFAIIQTVVIFQGSLSSWWTRIAIGLLLLAFILLQKLVRRGGGVVSRE